MAKKTQVVFSLKAWEKVESLVKAANEGFENGSITNSDVVNELILQGSADVKKLQSMHINLGKTLRSLASQKDLDINEVIDRLLDLKNGGPVKKRRSRKVEVQECLNE